MIGGQGNTPSMLLPVELPDEPEGLHLPGGAQRDADVFFENRITAGREPIAQCGDSTPGFPITSLFPSRSVAGWRAPLQRPGSALGRAVPW